jgi:hypothetical protein
VLHSVKAKPPSLSLQWVIESCKALAILLPGLFAGLVRLGQQF